MAEEIKQSMSGFQIVGTLKEIGLSREGIKERELGKKGSGIKETCNSISKPNKKDAALAVEVNGQVIEVDLPFGVFEKKINKDGQIVDNPDYKALETVIDTYEVGKTRVKIDGNVIANEYVSNKDGKFHTYAPKIKLFKITSTNVPDTDLAEGTITGILTQHSKEVFNETETGRIKVRIMSFDYSGNMYPVDIVVPKMGVTDDGEEFELADAFEDYFKTNDSVLFNVTAVAVQHGSTQKKSVGLGRSSNRVSGWVEQEIQLVGGSKIVADETEDEYDPNLKDYFITPEMVKKGNDAREVMIAKKEAEKASESTTTTTVKGSSASATSNPFGGSNPFA